MQERLPELGIKPKVCKIISDTEVVFSIIQLVSLFSANCVEKLILKKLISGTCLKYQETHSSNEAME